MDNLYEQKAQSLGIPPDVYIKILFDSIDYNRPVFAALESAIKQKDMVQIERHSHFLKGSYSNLLLSSISEPMTELNKIAGEGDIAKIQSLFDRSLKAFMELSDSKE